MNFRLRHTLALAGMLLRFFTRKVFRLGLLRSVVARTVAAVVIVAVMVVCIIAAYVFLKPITSEARVWQLLFDTATVSLVLWVQIAFLFVKTLFLSADGVLELSFQLPLTNRERSTAFLLYEMAMTAVVVGVSFVSLSVSAVLLLGPGALPRLLEAIIFPVVLAYLGLTVFYLLLQRLLGLRRWTRTFRNVAAVLALFAAVLVYTAQMPTLISSASQAYLGGEDRLIWVNALAWFSRHHGAPLTWAAVLVAIIALAALTLVLMPTQHVRHSRYFDAPVGRWLRRRLGPYDWCLIRSSQTALSGSLAVALFVYVCVRPTINPLWGLAVLSLTGLYQFAATAPLRGLVGSTTSPWRIYWSLVRAQLIQLGLMAVPAIVVVGVFDRGSWVSSLTALAGCAGGAALAICVGVLFPAEKDNPFSVFMGLSTTALVGAVVAIGLGLLQLPLPAMYAVVIAAAVVFVLFAVQGISISHARSRNEEGSIGRQLRDGRRTHDLGNGRDHAVVAGVLHR